MWIILILQRKSTKTPWDEHLVLKKKKSQILAFGAIKFAHGLFLRKAFSSLLPDFFYSFNALFFHAFPVFLHTQLLWYLLMESGDGGSLSPRSSMAARVRRDWSFPASESAEGDRDRTVQRGCEATRGRDTRVRRAAEGPHARGAPSLTVRTTGRPSFSCWFYNVTIS